MKEKYLFSEHKFYRKWYGRKWKLCLTSLSMVAVWMPIDEICGCFLYILEIEY